MPLPPNFSRTRKSPAVNLSPEEQIDADDDHRIGARRGSTQEAKPKKGRRKNEEPDEEEVNMTRTIQGKVHGKTIELDEDLGVADGQEVEVQVRVIPKTARRPGEGFLRTEGALADDTAWDAIMAEIYRERKGGKR